MVKINKVYKDLIDKLENVIRAGVSIEALNPIRSVMNELKILGQRPELDSSVDSFMDITTNMAKTYAAKNHDYGNSFDRSLNKFGLIAGLVRMGDKMNRLESLVNKKAMVKNESIKDTLLDLANYAIMTVMWLNKRETGNDSV
jgi:hypothetical protein